MWFFFLWVVASSWAYNIDVENAQIYTDPKEEIQNGRKSYFGFSVALYADPNVWENSLILVGAPRANVTQIKTVIEPGSVFKCPIHSSGSCKEWILDPTEDADIKFLTGITSKLRDNAWTGANIAIKNGTNPTVVVCAPRWKMSLGPRNMNPDIFMNGLCYRSRVNDSLLFERPIHGIYKSKIAPFYYANRRFQIRKFDGEFRYYYGMGEAGFSLHMVPNKEDLVLGSPGILDGKGSPFLVQVEENTPTREEMIYKNITNFSVKYNFIHDTNTAIGDDPSIRYSEYFGYSVSSGCYFREEERWFSSGIPRGDKLNGRVLIFSHPNRTLNSKFTIKSTLNGEQHGEYFGSVLASCDVNNDGKDDLIVGAPLWTDKFEEGRVYVFSNKDRVEDYLEAQYIHGDAVKGRFGSAISCIGDIDYDNYADIAIGAPYENNHGAIYIYRGSETGLQLSQKIIGSEISSSILGFGISISEARDIDGNGYPDIAVGAYLSDKAVLLRSKPIVTLKVSKIKHLGKPELQRNSTFFVIEVCFYYSGIRVPEKLNVTLHWQIDESFGRATLSQEANSARTLSRDIDSCENFTIHLNSNIQNFIEPIEISVSLNPETTQLNSTAYSKNGKFFKSLFCKTCPVINKEHSKIENSMTLYFTTICGPDDNCTSKLDISMMNDLRNNHFVVGSRNTFSVFVNISNQGDPVYQTEVQIYIPEPLLLERVPSECSENTKVTNGTKGIIEVTCSAGNPLKDNKTIKLELATSGLKCDSNYTELEVTLNVILQPENQNITGNFSYKMPIYFDVNLDILLSGKTQEDSYSYSEKEESNPVKNIKFGHIYEIQKFGFCAVEEVIVTLKIPTFLEEKDNDFRITKIVQMMGLIDNQEIQCFDSNKERLISLGEEHNSVNVSKIGKTTINNISKTFNIGVNSLKYVPPENRTLYINCSNPRISCISLNCKFSGLSNSTNTKILLAMELQSSIFKSIEMEGKDIIFFISEGEMIVTKSEGFANVIETRTNLTFVGTTFLGPPIEQKVALWILILSTLLGILLLTILSFILTKVGFFARKRRRQLHALKADSKRKRKQKAESTSAKAALQQDF